MLEGSEFQTERTATLKPVAYAEFHKGGGLHSANNKQKSLKTQYHYNRRHQL